MMNIFNLKSIGLIMRKEERPSVGILRAKEIGESNETLNWRASADGWRYERRKS